MTRIRAVIQAAADRARTLWRRVPPSIRSGWITAWITFIGGLVSILTGLLPTLADAISTGNFDTFFDALSLGYAAAVSAALAFLVGLLNTLFRWLRPIADAYRPPLTPRLSAVDVLASIPAEWDQGRPSRYMTDRADAEVYVAALVDAGLLEPPG